MKKYSILTSCIFTLAMAFHASAQTNVVTTLNIGTGTSGTANNATPPTINLQGHNYFPTSRGTVGATINYLENPSSIGSGWPSGSGFVYQTLNRPTGAWIWRDATPTSGSSPLTTRAQMMLDDTNELSLFDSTGASSIVLAPATDSTAASVTIGSTAHPQMTLDTVNRLTLFGSTGAASIVLTPANGSTPASATIGGTPVVTGLPGVNYLGLTADLSLIGGNGSTAQFGGFAFGDHCGALGSSVAIGYQNSAWAGSIAMGALCTAHTNTAVVMGYGNTATGNCGIALGAGLLAAGDSTLVTGDRSSATAWGAVATGLGSQAHSVGQVAIGRGNIPSGNDTASGPSAVATMNSNSPATLLFIIGNGTTTDGVNFDRSNAFTVSATGDVWTQGGITTNSLNVSGATTLGGNVTVSGGLTVPVTGDLSMGAFQ